MLFTITIAIYDLDYSLRDEVYAWRHMFLLRGLCLRGLLYSACALRGLQTKSVSCSTYALWRLRLRGLQARSMSSTTFALRGLPCEVYACEISPSRSVSRGAYAL